VRQSLSISGEDGRAEDLSQLCRGECFHESGIFATGFVRFARR
jgi:hypothetical protein